ncbi:DNA polymerase III subunit chi [Salinisphaera sp.]|uniref:DNA polymerase III subunit chi n=1 Tax=Salinisphaera sp. TaxID=1914330 RepID=UPI002D794F56|nr:DNA polymerase III subunit chi [Salinisphaera sp.]HET7315673.1 DNA polymerase III subunit chi [Salinisphaera sp.]
MTEVFFYILEDEAADATAHFACRLAEKAHGEGHRVFIHVADAAQTAALDNMLWQFRQGSFVPHTATDALAPDDDLTPVVIGAGEPPAGFDDILLNVGGEVGGFFSRFARHNEIVGPESMAAARHRYRFFKDRGYQLTTHKIPAR